MILSCPCLYCQTSHRSIEWFFCVLLSERVIISILSKSSLLPCAEAVSAFAISTLFVGPTYYLNLNAFVFIWAYTQACGNNFHRQNCHMFSC